MRLINADQVEQGFSELCRSPYFKENPFAREGAWTLLQLCVRSDSGKDNTIDAILDARDYGHYVIILNCNDTVRECAGWDDDYEPKGDSCALYPIDEYEKCPVCDQVTPLLEYCPECGHKLTAKGD